MNKKQLLDIFHIDDLADLPNAVMGILEGEASSRDSVYRRLLEVNNYDLSFDWFQGVYETELSERKQKKQDFTPNSVGVLAAMLTGSPKGTLHEPTAGNGSMIISNWWVRCQNCHPWEFLPSDHMIDCWELSGRSIPILLLNLSIRGMMGYVYHGDVLEQSVKAKYILLNRDNDSMGFSEIIKDIHHNLKIIDICDSKS